MRLPPVRRATIELRIEWAKTGRRRAEAHAAHGKNKDRGERRRGREQRTKNTFRKPLPTFSGRSWVVSTSMLRCISTCFRNSSAARVRQMRNSIVARLGLSDGAYICTMTLAPLPPLTPRCPRRDKGLAGRSSGGSPARACRRGVWLAGKGRRPPAAT